VSTQQYSRNRGSLFENAEKRKPSHPDLRGECAIDGTLYDMQAWRRDEQISLTLAPTRGDKNTYPPDAFRGALDPAPKTRGDDSTPTWVGDLVGDEERYTVRAQQKQGKSGKYLSLYFDRVEPG
jgi:hypothetical protein